MKPSIALFAAAACLCARIVAGQPPLTLDAAVSAALASNASLRASRAAADEAAARLPDARAPLLPRLSFVESWQRGDQPVFVFGSLLASRRFAAANFAIDALNHPDSVGFFRASVGAEQLLFDGGRARSALTAANIQRDLSRADEEQAGADLAVEVTRTFGRALTAQARGLAAESALAAAREDRARAERRRDAGTATDADVLGLAARIAELRQRVIQADADIATACAQLNRLMGQPVDRPLMLAVPPRMETANDTPPLEVLFAEADAHRPELRRAALSEQLAASESRAARAGRLPQVTAQASLDVSGTRFIDRASAWIVGGELRWTLSASGAEAARRKAAASAVTRAAAFREDARAAVHVDVTAAARAREAAIARQAVGRAAVDEARESERVIRDRFAAGMAGVTDLLRASSLVLEAQANETAALVDAVVSDALLRRALGRTP